MEAETQVCPDGLFLEDDKRLSTYERWGRIAPVGEVPCPGILSLEESRLVVGWWAGGCFKFRDVILDEQDDQIIVTSVVDDARFVHPVTAVDGKPLRWACTSELDAGVKALDLKAPLSHRRLLTQVRLLPPTDP